MQTSWLPLNIFFLIEIYSKWRKQLKLFHKYTDFAAIQLELIDLQQNDIEKAVSR